MQKRWKPTKNEAAKGLLQSTCSSYNQASTSAPEQSLTIFPLPYELQHPLLLSPHPSNLCQAAV